MILGDIMHLEAYKRQIPPEIYTCLEEIGSFPFEQVEDGKYIIRHYAMSIESPMTELAEKRKLEGHKEFIDVVYEVDAEEEWIGHRFIWDGAEEIEKDAVHDLYFYRASGEETKVHLKTGAFMICYPEDLHRPLCCGMAGPRKIRKAVLKFPVMQK